MDEKNLVIAGSRGFDNYLLLCTEVSAYIKDVENVKIVTGCARGVDYMATMYARAHSIAYEVHEADWTKYGKSAGPIRNREMAKKAHAGLIFWNGKSKGTRNMIEELRKQGVAPIKIIYF